MEWSLVEGSRMDAWIIDIRNDNLDVNCQIVAMHWELGAHDLHQWTFVYELYCALCTVLMDSMSLDLL